MKRLAVVLLVGALAALILQPVTSTVNSLSGNSGLRADGVPPPPFPPSSDSELRADGVPPPPSRRHLRQVALQRALFSASRCAPEGIAFSSLE